MTSSGLYIHIPFCVRKCAYCDFYSLPGKEHLLDRYIDAVALESSAHTGLTFDTLYIGGGTPSLLGPDGLTRLMRGLRRHLDISHLSEATLECNPDSTTPELLAAAVSAGIDRVSIGVQSLSNSELHSVGRIHTAAQALQAIDYVKQSGIRRVSADVIIGLPGQDWNSLHSTLETLLKTGVQHLSAYCLSLEEHTPLYDNPPPSLPSDDRQAELYEQLTEYLNTYGFIHYEISNYAQPGQASRHNLNYSRVDYYLGLGTAAASHSHSTRSKNAVHIDRYMLNPKCAVQESETLSLPEKIGEEAMLRLRLLNEGIIVADMTQKYGAPDCQPLFRRLDQLLHDNLLTCDGAAYRIPPSRVLTCNSILSQVLED